MLHHRGGPDRCSGEDLGKDLLVALDGLPGPCPERGAEVAQGPARRQDLPGYHTHPLLLQAELAERVRVSPTASTNLQKTRYYRHHMVRILTMSAMQTPKCGSI